VSSLCTPVLFLLLILKCKVTFNYPLVYSVLWCQCVSVKA